MAASETTKKYKALYWVFNILSFAVTIVPLCVYIIIGFSESQLVAEKVGLTCTIIIAIILTAINIIFKYHIRSILWILVLGIYFCLDEILVLILLLSIGTILDEFVLTPLKNSYKNKFTINKEIDKRI